MEQTYCLFCMNPATTSICDVCGRKKEEYTASLHHLLPGTLLENKYFVGSVLGEGGFGITYIGHDVNLDIKIAIKEYFPSGIVNRNNTCSNEITAHMGNNLQFFEKAKKSFMDEARKLAKFSGEPSIVSVRDFFSANNTAYIVMEYLEGVDLKDHLNRHGKFTFDEAVTLLTPIMKGLSKIHSKNLIHRDISPANIMILNNGMVKLLDFGAAREVNNEEEKSLSIVLKIGYAPEEQYRTRGQQGPWTDVYALSATMYKLITGVTPVASIDRIRTDELVKPHQFNPSITHQQEEVLLKGMGLYKENRYQTANELLSACQRVMTTASNERTEKIAPPVMLQKRFCAKCGSKIKPTDMFCKHCGIRLTKGPMPAGRNVVYPAPVSVQPNLRNSLRNNTAGNSFQPPIGKAPGGTPVTGRIPSQAPINGQNPTGAPITGRSFPQQPNTAERSVTQNPNSGTPYLHNPYQKKR